MVREYFEEWLKQEIEKTNDEDSLSILEHIGNKVQFASFDDILYVKLKQEYNIEKLQYGKEYEATTYIGGEYLVVCTDKVLEFVCDKRDKFEVMKVFNPYKNKVYDKEDIEKLKEIYK